MNETIGDFVEDARMPLSGVTVEMAGLDFVAHWHRCSLTADWMAKVAAYDFQRRDVAANVISTVVNELLENAVKFSSDKRAPVRLALRHYGDVVSIETRNIADAEAAAAVRSSLADLATKDLESLFIARVQDAAPATSRLGLIILKKDYGAAIGVRLTGEPKCCVVEVRVRIVAEEVDHR